MQTLNPESWTRLRDKDMPDRIGQVPDELMHHIRRVNQATGHPSVPSRVEAPVDFLQDLRGAMTELPVFLQNLLDAPLLGIFLARGLGCSAVTDVVVHADKAIGAVIALDVEVLQSRSANTWATWKENEPFSADESAQLLVTIETPEQDVRKNAIQFILLHEIGHVLTAGSKFLPDWWINPRELKRACDYSYLEFSWQIDVNRQIVPNESCKFPMRNRLAFYTGALITTDSLDRLYEELSATSFATLYAANNAYEDFAECFALYVHTVVMNRPYQIEISGDRTRVLSDKQSVEARCGMKYAFLKGLFSEAQSQLQ